MSTTAPEIVTNADVVEISDIRLTLGWVERRPCVDCAEPTRYAAPNPAWEGKRCEAGCCDGPTMPLCAICVDGLSGDARARLVSVDQ